MQAKTNVLALFVHIELSVIIFLQDRWQGEGLRLLTDKLNSKNYYAFNPSFDKGRMGKNK